ncbi:MAG: DUF3313 family protein [Tepidisphaeraceae bacterium]
MIARIHVAALAVICVSSCIVGCKAQPAKPAGFVDDSTMTKDPSLPFHKVWFKPGFEFASYKQIYVAPVNTSYMLKMTDWQKGERKDEIEKDTAKLGLFSQEAIKKAFRDDPAHRFTVVESPTADGKTLIFEFALVEVVPSKVVLNALGFAPYFVGLGLSVFRAAGHDVSSAAFEARIRDAGTNLVVAMLADREQEQTAAVSVRGLTWYSHAETIVRQWSSQFVRLANRKPGEQIRDTDPFTLQPW